MEDFTKEAGIKIKEKVKVMKDSVTEILMMEIIFKEKFLAKDYINGSMVIIMMVNGKMD